MKIFYWTPYMEKVGTIKATVNSAIAMKRRGHEVKLYKTYKEWEGYEQLLADNGIEIIDFGLSKKLHNLSVVGVGYRISMIIISLHSYRRLKKNYAQEKPDIVLSSLLGYLPLLARKHAKYQPKIVCSIQGKPYFHSFRKHLWKWLYKDADQIITLTDKTREDMLEQLGLPESLFETLPNPVIDDRMDQMLTDTSVDLGVPSDKKLILGIGRLTRQKDFGTLFRAFAKLPERDNCCLYILGEGEEEQQLKTLARELGIEQEVVLTGFVKNPHAYLHRADVFVLSSLWEDAGLTLIEAAYSKTPIVCTKCPYGQVEFLDYGEAGELCEISDVEDMAQAISHVLETIGKPEREAKVQRAYHNAMQYHMTTHGEELDRVLQAVIRE